jgi:hypothetical protein
VIGASLVSGFGRLQPAQTPLDERQLTRESFLRSDLADYGLGTTHSGEYLPVTSGQRNAARFRKMLLDDPARSSAAAASTLDVRHLGWRTDRIRAEVQASTTERLVVHQFAFPGWAATLDGSPVGLTPSGPLGLVSIEVPAGTHVVEFAWQETPLRGVATALSLLALLTLSLLGGLHGWRLLVAIGGCLAVTGALAILAFSGLPLTDGSPSDAVRSQPLNENLVLLEVHQDTFRMEHERVLITDVTWLVREPAPGGVRVRLQIVGAGGVTHDADWAYEALSRHWQRGELVRTTIATRLPADFLAGPAEMRLSLPRPGGENTLDLGRVTIPPAGARPTPPPPGAPVAVGQALTVTPGGIRAAGWLPGSTARPGGAIDIDLEWRTSTTPEHERDYVAVLTLQGPAGDLTSEPGRPGDWFAPLPFWQVGDIIVQRLRIDLPSTLRPGSYPLTARIYARDLARGGLAAPGAARAPVRSRPLAEIALGEVLVGP